MKFKSITYKGIKFKTFDVCGFEGDHIYGPKYEGPLEDINDFRLMICSHCIQKYNLLNMDADELKELREVENDPDYEDDAETCDMTGCNNRAMQQIYVDMKEIDDMEADMSQEDKACFVHRTIAQMLPKDYEEKSNGSFRVTSMGEGILCETKQEAKIIARFLNALYGDKKTIGVFCYASELDKLYNRYDLYCVDLVWDEEEAK